MKRQAFDKPIITKINKKAGYAFCGHCGYALNKHIKIEMITGYCGKCRREARGLPGQLELIPKPATPEG
jgi:hypothetical protein